MVEKIKEVDDFGVKELVVEKTSKSILRNTAGKEVPEADYFFGSGKAPVSFEKMCGTAVDREDLVEVFNNIFNPNLNFLFYKSKNKEVYIVIVPIKYSTIISKENESSEGDFQKHAISFIGEGSVNIDTLKLKLKRITPFCRIGER
jgi:hypothetical protein